ncbi:cytochrome c family protein [soil metagenome]
MTQRMLSRWISCGLFTILVGMGAAIVSASPLLNTQLNDFYFYGTQPYPDAANNPNFDPFLEPDTCAACHQDYSEQQPADYSVPYNRWTYSMMAQAWRDPIFQAQFDISELDAPFSGDGCIRCHAPAAFVQGQGNIPGVTTVPERGFRFDQSTRSGVECSYCHRRVDEFPAAENPSPDAAVYAQLGANALPNFPAVGLQPGGPVAANGYIVDNRNNRRGPFDPSACFHNATYESPYHTEALMCASCHDISNTLYTKQGDGSYALNPDNTRHPTGNKYEMYPMDRLYSEWSKSAYAATGVMLTAANPNIGATPAVVGRYSYDGVTRTPPTIENPAGNIVVFNGNTTYTTCQSCHMPETSGVGCDPNLAPPVRPNVPIHNFTGANSWTIRAVADVWGLSETRMDDPDKVDQSARRNQARMTQASDTTLSLLPGGLNVRITNNCGHKLPGGFAEGRKIWINVRFKNALGAVIAECGAYDAASATLTTSDTKVYELVHGVDAAVSTVTGLPVGKTFHIDINNKVYKDNRIPPRGFNNAAFTAIQSGVIGYTYADGQYWDDTLFALPAGAVTAEVRVYHQTTDRDYAEFLRDHSTTVQPLNDQNSMPQPGPDTWTAPPGTPPAPLTVGQIAYAQWVKWGKSAPVEMDLATIALPTSVRCQPADIADDQGNPLPTGSPNNGVNEGDYNAFFNTFFNNQSVGSPADIAYDDGSPLPPFGPAGGVNNGVNEGDYNAFFNNFFNGCP